MEFIQRFVHDLARIVEWEARVLRERVMRLVWGAALALLAVTLVLVTLLFILGAVYVQVSAAGGVVAGLLTAAALALLCALGAGLAARGIAER